MNTTITPLTVIVYCGQSMTEAQQNTVSLLEGQGVCVVFKGPDKTPVIDEDLGEMLARVAREMECTPIQMFIPELVEPTIILPIVKEWLAEPPGASLKTNPDLHARQPIIERSPLKARAPPDSSRIDQQKYNRLP
ncbi:MAG: hypothetical protein RSD49_18260 [Hafnia sp.]